MTKPDAPPADTREQALERHKATNDAARDRRHELSAESTHPAAQAADPADTTPTP